MKPFIPTMISFFDKLIILFFHSRGKTSCTCLWKASIILTLFNIMFPLTSLDPHFSVYFLMKWFQNVDHYLPITRPPSCQHHTWKEVEFMITVFFNHLFPFLSVLLTYFVPNYLSSSTQSHFPYLRYHAVCYLLFLLCTFNIFLPTKNLSFLVSIFYCYFS